MPLSRRTLLLLVTPLALPSLLAAATATAAPARPPAQPVAPAPPAWRTLAPGVAYARLAVAPGDTLEVVRVDPARARLRAVMASALDRPARTAGAWCREQHLAAAINLGMYLEDELTNVGHAQTGAHVNQPRWNQYQSVLALEPARPGLPPALIVDLDRSDARARLAEYRTTVQNLRLIAQPARNVWQPQPRRWSEAALAMDASGRILFIFARAPHAMFDFNRVLLAAPLAIVAAMHVEGGPEASLSIHAGGVDLDANGSYETGFVENDGEAAQWAIPNVLGVMATDKR